MANTKDFIVKNAVEVGGDTKVTVGSSSAGSVGYSLSSASYDSKSFSVASELSGPFPQDGFIGSSDTKFYVVEASSTSVYQYTMSTANDITTASYDSKSFDFSTQEGSPRTIHIKDDGTKLYTVGTTNDTVYQYTLSTAWDVSTASYDSVSFSVSSQSTTPVGMFIGNSGSNLYIYDGTEVIYQYTLSTAWDVSSASYDSKSFSVSAQDTNGKGLWFKSDGTIMYTSGYTTGEFFEYSLTTAWDVSTASYVRTFDASAQGAVHSRPIFNSDGTKMYSVSNTNDVIYQYSTLQPTQNLDLSTGNYFSHTPTSDLQYTFSNPADVQSFQLEVTGGAEGYDLANASYDSVSLSVANEEAAPNGVAFKPDGTKMYVVGQGGDDVNEYDLSTAWDVSTASYVQIFDVSSQDVTPQGIQFKPDGTKMYVNGIANDNIYEYDLSTAWDISTASYSTSMSLSGYDGATNGFCFNNDGTKVFTTGSTVDSVREWALSPAWDISSGSHVYNFKVNTEETSPEGVTFNSDGTKMFVIGLNSDTVHQYTLSTGFDLTTAAYSNVSFSVASQDGSPRDVAFSSDGRKMYVAGATNDTIFQYSTLGSSPTITWSSAIQWAGGTAPDAPALDEKDTYTFMTDDTGTSYIGFQSGDAFS